VNVDVSNALLLGGANEGKEVVDVRVNTTVGQETHEVKASVGSLGVLEAGNDQGLLLELVVLDSWAGLACSRDTNNLHWSMRTMSCHTMRPAPMLRCLTISIHPLFYALDSPNLRVAHETLLQADSKTGSVELDKVVVVTDGVHAGGVAVEDGVALLVVGESPAIVNAEVSVKCMLRYPLGETR
jgi:hypothetical protein